MTIDPVLIQIVVDSADAALFAAAMASGDTWEWEAFLDGVGDVDHAKRLLGALGGLYVNLASELCSHNGIDHVEFLHRVAVEQIAVADRMQRGESS